MLSSRTLHLEQELSILDYHMALKAFDIVISVMCKENGYSRHDGRHYYHHLVDVTQTLRNWHIRNENILTASLLHDIVEDVPGYTIEWVAEEFNEEVASIVSRVTKPKGYDKYDPEHLEQYIAVIEQDIRACLLKTGDLMHNSFTLLDATDEMRNRKIEEIMTYYIPFFKRCRERFPRYNKIFFGAKTNITNHFQMIIKLQNEKEELKKQIQALQDEKKNL